MDLLLKSIYIERTKDPNVLGILMIDKKNHSLPTTDTFDVIFFIVVKEADQPVFISHYSFEDKKAALHVVTDEQLRNWILFGTNKKVFDWLYNGKVLYERNDYVFQLRKELKDFPFNERKIKMGLEFAKLIRRYIDGKAFFENGDYLDAYNNIIHALHHLARLAVIEKGFHPEVTVWKQVKKIEPEVNKLYEELVMSDEPLNKRLELLFLASEFLLHSKEEMGASHLLEILSEKKMWSFNEIMSHKELSIYSIDLTILLEYFVEKGMIKVKNVQTKKLGIYERYYTIQIKR